MDIALITDVDQLTDYVSGWEDLADRVSEPRAGAATLTGWARHMMHSDSEVRIWIACEGSEVVGVLPFALEKMPRKRVRLLPPMTDMMLGAVPIADPDRAEAVVGAIVDAFSAQSDLVEMASIFWLPEHSPWMARDAGWRDQGPRPGTRWRWR